MRYVCVTADPGGREPLCVQSIARRGASDCRRAMRGPRWLQVTKMSALVSEGAPVSVAISAAAPAPLPSG
jgi:hypothetical protein